MMIKHFLNLNFAHLFGIFEDFSLLEVIKSWMLCYDHIRKAFAGGGVVPRISGAAQKISWGCQIY